MREEFNNNPNYDVEWAKHQFDEGNRIKWVFFWGHRPARDGSVSASCFSQWWEGHAFTVDNQTYPTAEHWMMAEKARLFDCHDIAEQILAASNPGKVKALGQQVTSFSANIWNTNKYGIVKEGNFHKFSQNSDLAAFLRNTGARILVEASPVDRIWGVGLARNAEGIDNPHLWRGENLLGFALMEVRDRLNAGYISS